MDKLNESSSLPIRLDANALAASWLRSERQGLRQQDPLSDALLPAAELNERLEANARLLTFSRPVIENLYHLIDCPSSVLLLTDGEGLILSALGDASFLGRANRVALCPGAHWSETAKGTNAIGTALATRRAVSIHGDEHYLARNQFLTCVATPIFSPVGGIAGILDLSTDARANLSHADALLKTTAELIEHRLAENFDQGFLLLHFHYRSDLLGTPFEGVAVFDEEGQLVAANRLGRRLLQGDERSPAATAWADFFPLRWKTMVDLVGVRCSTIFPLQDHARRHWYVRGERIGATAPGAAASFSLGAEGRGAGTQGADQAGPVSAAVQPSSVEIDPRVASFCPSFLDWYQNHDCKLMLLRGETGTGKRFVLHRCCHEHNVDLPIVELDGFALAREDSARREFDDVVRAGGDGLIYVNAIDQLPAELLQYLLQQLHRVRIVASCRAPRAEDEAAAELASALRGTAGACVFDMPRLRGRSDFATLVHDLVASASPQRPIHVPAPTMDCLQNYPWPGNVSELNSVLRLVLALLPEQASEIGVADLPPELLD